MTGTGQEHTTARLKMDSVGQIWDSVSTEVRIVIRYSPCNKIRIHESILILKKKKLNTWRKREKFF